MVVVVVVRMVAVVTVVTVAFVVFVVVVVVFIRRVRKIARRSCYLHHACQSFCSFTFPHETIWHPLNVFVRCYNGIFFTKICQIKMKLG